MRQNILVLGYWGIGTGVLVIQVICTGHSGVMHSSYVPIIQIGERY